MPRWLLVVALAFTPAVARADVAAKAVEYRDGAAVLEGCLVTDSAWPAGKRPAVLVAHESGGNTPAARLRAVQLSRLGYVVFCVDLYGKGVIAKDSKDAAAKAKLTDRAALRTRTEAALTYLAKLPQVDPQRVGGVGYGVGGTALFELARTGADLEGVACIHGDPTTPAPSAEEAKKISASLLLIVGSDAPYATPAQLAAFENEMRPGGVDWQVLRYGGVVHDFTNVQAGRNLASGAAYDADADQRTARAVQSFLAEAFPAKATVAARPAAVPKPAATPGNFPAKVLTVLKHVDDTGEALPNYEGGRTFLNIERRLVQTDGQGKRIKYREWDVNPLRPGVNRGAERMITGSDGSAYYTEDHYRSFKKMR